MKPLAQIFGACLALWSASAAAAENIAEARDLYAAGDYVEAADAAALNGGGEGFALAAKALVAHVLVSVEGADAAILHQALEYAEAGVAADGDSVDARLQLAVVLWLQGRDMNRFESFARGLPRRARDLIESALVDEPDNAWAHALLGAWNFEVVRRGGGGVLNADLETGASQFYRAMELDPDNAAIAVQCAVSFLSIDPELYAEHARIAFQRALLARADDAFETEMQAEADRMSMMLAAGRREALNSEVARWTGG